MRLPHDGGAVYLQGLTSFSHITWNICDGLLALVRPLRGVLAWKDAAVAVDSRSVPVWVRDRLPFGDSDSSALWIAVRLELPRIGIGYVEWGRVAERLGWGVERTREAIRRLEASGVLYVDGSMAWTPGAVEADQTIHLSHGLQRRGILNALARLPERPLVSAFRITYGLVGDDWWIVPADPEAALLIAGEREPPNGWVWSEPQAVVGENLSAQALRAEHRQGPPENPTLGLDGKSQETMDVSLRAQRLKSTLGVTGDYRGQESFMSIPEEEKKQQKGSGEGSTRPPYEDMWKVLQAEGMVKSLHKLTDLRRGKLKALWEEHLKRAPEPLDLLTRVCRAVKADQWWGARQDTWLPETCWRNAERREKFTISAEEHRGGPPTDRYSHLVNRGR